MRLPFARPQLLLCIGYSPATTMDTSDDVTEDYADPNDSLKTICGVCGESFHSIPLHLSKNRDCFRKRKEHEQALLEAQFASSNRRKTRRQNLELQEAAEEEDDYPMDSGALTFDDEDLKPASAEDRNQFQAPTEQTLVQYMETTNRRARQKERSALDQTLGVAPTPEELAYAQAQLFDREEMFNEDSSLPELVLNQLERDQERDLPRRTEHVPFSESGIMEEQDRDMLSHAFSGLGILDEQVREELAIDSDDDSEIVEEKTLADLLQQEEHQLVIDKYSDPYFTFLPPLTEYSEAAKDTSVNPIHEIQGASNDTYEIPLYLRRNKLKTYMRIFQLLDEVRAPKSAFDELMNILREGAAEHQFSASDNHPTRQHFKTQIEKMFGKRSTPTPIEVGLETTIKPDDRFYDMYRSVTVYTFDVEEKIRFGLSDPEIMSNLDNLNVDPDNPFGPYPSNMNIGEVYSGNWYRRAYRKYCAHDPANNFLCGSFIYVDKSGTSMVQRHGLEPVMLGFHLHKRHLREQAFRCNFIIGYIPDLQQLSKALKKETRSDAWSHHMNSRNYHKCLQPILQQLVDIQKKGGIKMWLRLGRHVRYVTVHILIYMVLGDGKSNDMLCARVAHYAQTRTIRGCYCILRSLSDHTRKPFWNPDGTYNPGDFCRLVLQEDQRLLLDACEEITQDQKEKMKRLREALKKVSTIRVDSIMMQLDYGGHPWAQFLACTMDLMHALELGFIKDVVFAFDDPLTDADRKVINMIHAAMCLQHRSSMRTTYPRTNFDKGISDFALLNANEWPGVLLSYLIVSCTYKGKYEMDNRLEVSYQTQQRNDRENWEALEAKRARHIRMKRNGDPIPARDRVKLYEKERMEILNKIKRDKNGKIKDLKDFSKLTPEHQKIKTTTVRFRLLCDKILSFHAWTKEPVLWPSMKHQEKCQTLQIAMFNLLEQLKTTLARNVGNGWDKQKLHEIICRLVRQILEFGSPNNSSCQTGERALKIAVKDYGRKASKVTLEDFNRGTANAVCEADTMAHAQLLMGITSKKNALNNTTPETSWRYKSYSDKKQDDGRVEKNPAFVCWWQKQTNESTVGSQSIDLLMTAEYKHSAPSRGPKPEFRSCFLNLLAKHCYTNIMEKEQMDNSARADYYKQKQVFVWTEYKKGKYLYRCHPNYNSGGPWYDWALIPCPNRNRDLRYVHWEERDKPKPRKDSKHVNWVNTKYAEIGPHIVPAKIIHFFTVRDIETGKDVTELHCIVHACAPWNKDNESMSCQIMENHRLQSKVEKKKGRKKRGGEPKQKKNKVDPNDEFHERPIYNIIKASSLIRPVEVYEEVPGIYEHKPREESQHSVIMLLPYEEWASEFFEHTDSSGNQTEKPRQTDVGPDAQEATELSDGSDSETLSSDE